MLGGILRPSFALSRYCRLPSANPCGLAFVPASSDAKLVEDVADLFDVTAPCDAALPRYALLTGVVACIR